MRESDDYINILWNPRNNRYVGDWNLGEHYGAGFLGNDLDALTRNIIFRSEECNMREVNVKSLRNRLYGRYIPMTTDDFDLTFLFLNDPEYNKTGIEFIAPGV